MAKSFSRIILEKATGFLVFLIALGIANIFIESVSSQFYPQLIEFFNASLFFLFVIFIFDLISDIFWNTKFPINLIAPLSSALLGVFILGFILSIFSFILDKTNIGIDFPFGIIYFIVVTIILVIGYVKIFSGLDEKGKKKGHPKDSKKDNYDDISWDEIGNEFKKAFYNLGKRMNNAFDPEKGKNKKRVSKRKK